ncbi:hypothetical protein [Marinicauda sp. Alg238-R41]|jgi:hypothetical protein|uniref:hypothetical protein n=1 Tax=Marinicauda sp. Alg238-R41 TaxID=2993447 RepID=UPI0022E3D11D|nr:hypothetical protein [Marinicauda sp. Alg238-R41]
MPDDTIETSSRADSNLLFENLRGEGKVNDKTERKAHSLSDRLTQAYYRAAADFDTYLEFRRAKKIRRAAQYPDSHIMHFSILAALVLFEGLANAYFFSKGSDLGLLGGWIQAITVAFTNVIAAFFLIGFLSIRGLSNPKRPVTFGAALVSLPLAIVAIGFLNFSAAHYRDLLELNAATLALGDADVTGEILAPVSRALTFAPFETLEALLLFVLGVTFAAIAAFKGATFDDPVIGYGSVQRRLERSAAELAAVLKQMPWDSSGTPSGGVRTLGHARETKIAIDEFFASLVGQNEVDDDVDRAQGRQRRDDDSAPPPPPRPR